MTSDRARNLARSRRNVGRTPVTVLTRIHRCCQNGLHLWCPGTVGRKEQDCLCACHSGRKTALRAVA